MRFEFETLNVEKSDNPVTCLFDWNSKINYLTAHLPGGILIQLRLL